MGTVFLAHITTSMHSQEYNVYFRAMRQRIAARIPCVLEGRQLFAAEISGVGTACLPHIIVEMYSRECNVHCRAIGQGLAALIHSVFKGQAVFRCGVFGGWALCDWLILLLECTPRNILCILEPLDGGQQPPIQWVLESWQFFADGISGVGTACLARIIADRYAREYNAYSKPIRQMQAARIQRVLEGQAAFRS